MFSDSPYSSAAFSALGNVNVSVAVTGVQGTTALGNETIVAAANVFPTGVIATGNVGSVTVTADANVSVTGEVGTTALG
jgi:hypothetical protein